MKKCLAIFLILTLASLLMLACKTGESQRVLVDNEGQWVLVDSEFHEEEWYAELASKQIVEYPIEAQVSKGSFTWTNSYIGVDWSDENSSLFNPRLFPGNSISTQGSWAEPSKIVSGPDYRLSMGLNIKVGNRHSEYPLEPNSYIYALIRIPKEGGDGSIEDDLKEDGGILNNIRVADDDGETKFSPSSENGYAPIDEIVYGDMGKGERVGELRVLEVRVGLGHPPLMSYFYEWQEL